MELPKILIIGGGTIGSILIEGSISLTNPDNVIVADRNPNNATKLQKEFRIKAIPLAANLAENADIIMLAIKPQDFLSVASALNNQAKNKLIISVMAGISMVKIKQSLGSTKIVRTMPNTPARIGMGMTVWTATEEVTTDEREFVERLLISFGKQMHVDSDLMIDKATAVSGSGPAYVFLFAEQLMNAAQELGFDEKQATLLIEQTIRGTGELLHETPELPATLRQQVTSKGGTTEAAIESLPKSELQAAWTKAMATAFQRAKELSEIQ
ncbi:MAG: pyrroline-5-carboxylate reductase [bacterium]|nr:pyrroline-5-carboxylate reductase [bacterium]